MKKNLEKLNLAIRVIFIVSEAEIFFFVVSKFYYCGTSPHVQYTE